MTEPEPRVDDTMARVGHSVRAGLAAAGAVCLVVLLVATFELSMADWPSAVVVLLILPLMALLFIGASLWSATQLLRIRRDGAKFALPFLLCMATLLVLLYAPLGQIYLRLDFHWHRTARENIVARVAAGELKPNVAHNWHLIALGDDAPRVSAGNEIVVDQAEGLYVLFLTSRGLQHNFTGFLYVPPGADPKDFFEFDDQPPSQLVPYGGDWYFVAN